VRTSLIAVGSFLLVATLAFGQGYREESSWSSTLTMYGPLLILVIVWLVIWRRIGFGKGGYRKFLTDNQERMAQMEKHLSEISSQLERIASALERPER
jgi:hypothetical protein